jgi:threonine/homoserine efflux transporter RhtA
MKIYDNKGLFGYEGIEHFILIVSGLATVVVVGFVGILLVALVQTAGVMSLLWVTLGIMGLALFWSIGWLLNKWRGFL